MATKKVFIPIKRYDTSGFNNAKCTIQDDGMLVITGGTDQEVKTIMAQIEALPLKIEQEINALNTIEDIKQFLIKKFVG